MSIELKNISKKYKGISILEDINLSLDSGNTYGFVGTNGSGKTMLLRVIAGLVIPNTGEVRVNGDKLHEDISFPINLGMVIEQPSFLENLSGFKNLIDLAKIQKKIGIDEVKKYIELLGLDPENKNPVKKYSLGMKQRLSIAQAIMENPDVIILDEPFNGLDEKGVVDVRSIILNLKMEGKTILLTSHNKDDINLLCDEVYKIENGKVSYKDDGAEASLVND